MMTNCGFDHFPRFFKTRLLIPMSFSHRIYNTNLFFSQPNAPDKGVFHFFRYDRIPEFYCLRLWLKKPILQQNSRVHGNQ